MGRMAWGATTPRVCLGSVAIGKRLWRSRAVEKSQSRLSHRAWKSRPKRGIPTSPQPRRRRVINRQPDNSLATKTGPFNLLRTCFGSGVKDRFFDCRDNQAQGEGNWQISFGLASSSIFPSLTSFTAHTRLSSDSRGVCRSKGGPELLRQRLFDLGDT